MTNTNTTSVSNYKTFLTFFFVLFYKTSFKFSKEINIFFTKIYLNQSAYFSTISNNCTKIHN
jgi:hypothetical protein